MKSPITRLKNAINYYRYSYFISKLLSKSDSTQCEVERIGSKYGGWYIPANQINKESTCYCAGVGEDISFDLGLIKQYSCQVYAFDPTPRAIEYARNLAKKNPSFHFYDWGLHSSNAIKNFYSPKNPNHVSYSVDNLQETQDYFEAQCKRLSTIMKELNHERVDLLKLDIEGAELEVLRTAIEEKLDIGIICVEFHPQLGLKKIKEIVTQLIQWKYYLIKTDSWDYTFLERTINSS